MKRKIALIIAVVFIVMQFPIISVATIETKAGSNNSASTYEDSNFIYEYNVADSTATVKGYKGASKEPSSAGNAPDHVVSIPSTVQVNINGEEKTFSVTAIAERAFENNRSITAVTFPATVTSIGKNAFNCCVNLKTVNFSENMISIGENAFFSCTRLTGTITIPESVTTLGAGAFYDCININKVDIKGSLTSVGDYAFGNCESLVEVHFEKAPKEISQQMFMRCWELVNINLPEGIETIDTRAFDSCDSLSNGNGNLVIPNSVVNIGNSAFIYCESIKTVSIPNSTIGKQAFMYCGSLNQVVFTEKDQEPIISSTPDIGEGAFWGTALNKIVIPKHVDNIEGAAFSFSGLTEIAVDSGNRYFSSSGGVLFNKDNTILVAYPQCKSGASYTVSGVTEIYDWAFDSAENLKDITLQDGLKTIGKGAFGNCWELTSMVIPNSVTQIEEFAFTDCVQISSIDLPNNINSIEEGTFNACYSLAKIDIPDSVTAIQQDAFSSCYSLEKLFIPKNVNSISPEAFMACSNLKSLDIHKDNNSFAMKDGVLFSKDGSNLILYMPGNNSGGVYAVPEQVTNIGDNAFAFNSNVDAILMHENVKTIGNKAIGFSTSEYGGTDRAKDFYINCPSGNEAAKAYATSNRIAYFEGKPALASERIKLKAGETKSGAVSNAPGNSVLYTSSDESIAKVDRKTGDVTGVSKGETYIVASIGAWNSICKVEVTTGEKPEQSGTEYTLLKADDDYTNWIKAYHEYNSETSFDPKDNSNLREYTSNDYVAILAKTQGGKYIATSNEYYGVGGYEQYGNIASNLSLEIGRYKLNENMVVFRGTSDVSQYTKARASGIEDMYDSIGETVRTGNKDGEDRYGGDWVASTSIDHNVSLSFAGGSSTATVLEIYAPKDYTRGAYINDFSYFAGESEILMDGGTDLKVLDAGVRVVKRYEGTDYEEEVLERYMKLQIVGVKGNPIQGLGTPVVVYKSGDVPPAAPSYDIIIDKEQLNITEALSRAGIDTETEISNRLYDALSRALGSEFEIDNTAIWDIKIVDDNKNPIEPEKFPRGGVKITIDYPDEVKNNYEDYDFTIVHMYGENRGSVVKAGDIEGPMTYNKTKDGLEVTVNSLSPFAIHWTKSQQDDNTSQGGTTDTTTKNDGVDTGDDTQVWIYALIMIIALVIIVGCIIHSRRKAV